MKFKNFIILTLTFLIIGCDGSYQSNDDEMLYEIDPFLKSGGFVVVGDDKSNLDAIKKLRFSSKSKKIAPDLINSL